MGQMPRLRVCGEAAQLPRSRPAESVRQRAHLLAGLHALASLTTACAPPHPGTSLIVASKAHIDSLDALRGSPSMDLHQGDYIQLPPAAIGVLEPLDPAGADAQLIQVIGFDQHGNRCWVRRWPLARHGSPVFELLRGQVQEPLPHRPLPVGRRVG